MRLNGRWDLNLPDYRVPQWERGWEERRLDALYSVVTPGEVLFDVGAETGDMSALYASWDLEVVPVEPSASAWPMIRDVFERNDLLPLLGVPAFADRRTHPVPIWQRIPGSPWPIEADGPVETEPKFVHLDEQPDDETTLRIRLDDLPAAARIITVDVEGSELEVLAGANDYLVKWRPIWFVSVHPAFIADRWNRDWRDVLRLFEEADYDGQLLDARHEQHWLFLP